MSSISRFQNLIIFHCWNNTINKYEKFLNLALSLYHTLKEKSKINISRETPAFNADVLTSEIDKGKT